MKVRTTARLLAMFLMAVSVNLGCSNPESDSSAALDAPSNTKKSAKSDGSGDSSAMLEACLASSNMGEVLCKCTADKAVKDLSKDGYDFLVASLNQNKEEQERLRSKLPLEEAMKAGLFMAKGPAECAAEAAN